MAALVDGTHQTGADTRFDDEEDEHIENLRKMFLPCPKMCASYSISCATGCTTVRTSRGEKDEKRRLTALETMHVYAPLAHPAQNASLKRLEETLRLQYLDPIYRYGDKGRTSS